MSLDPITRLRCQLGARPSEAEFAAFVEDCFDLGHWRWHHEVDSRKSKRGFPDYVAVKDGRVVAVELKTNKGRVRPGQNDWIADLGQVAGVYAAIWRPDDWRLVMEVTGVDRLGEVA